MDKRIAEWLASGDTGSSSKTIMLWLSGGVIDAQWGADAPRDAGDLARCLRLLERVPEWRGRVPEMAGAGGLWPTFVKHWDEIVRTFMEECAGTIPERRGPWPETPRTNALMRRTHDEAYAADSPDFTEVRFDAGKLAGCSVKFSKDSPYAAAFARMKGAK